MSALCVMKACDAHLAITDWAQQREHFVNSARFQLCAADPWQTVGARNTAAGLHLSHSIRMNVADRVEDDAWRYGLAFDFGPSRHFLKHPIDHAPKIPHSRYLRNAWRT